VSLAEDGFAVLLENSLITLDTGFQLGERFTVSGAIAMAHHRGAWFVTSESGMLYTIDAAGELSGVEIGTPAARSAGVWRLPARFDRWER
jgi:hypothetical protein